MWRTTLAPVTAATACAVAIWLTLSNYDLLTGSAGGAADWLWVLIPVAAATGYAVGRIRGLDNLDFDQNVLVTP